MTRPRTNRGWALPCQSIREARHLSSVARSGCAASSPTSRTSRKCNESFPEEEHLRQSCRTDGDNRGGQAILRYQLVGEFKHV
jgi:hypothetical protein